MKKISLLVIAVLLFLNSYAQNSHYGHDHSHEMEIWHRAQLDMEYSTFQELSTNGLLVHAKYENGKVINDFTEHELEVLQELGFQAEILIEDIFSHDAQNFNPVVERSYTDGSYQTPSNFAYGTASGRNGMWTYTEVNQILDQMRSLYPNLISEKTNQLNGVDYFQIITM